MVAGLGRDEADERITADGDRTRSCDILVSIPSPEHRVPIPESIKNWRRERPGNEANAWQHIIHLASFPGSPEREINTRGELAWYIFSRDQNRARVFRTERQRFVRYSTSFAFNAWCV